MSVSAPGAPVYLINGDDAHLAQTELRNLTQGSDLTVVEFGPTDAVQSIIEAISTGSIFGDERVVVVKGADQMPAEAAKQLASRLEQSVEGVRVVVVATKAPAAITAAVRKAGRVIEVSKGGKGDLLNWLATEAKSRELNFTGDALNALVRACGPERSALFNALEQLAVAHSPGTRITPKMVVNRFSGSTDANIFAFIDHVAMGEAGPALEALNLLVAKGETPLGIVFRLAGHFRMLVNSHQHGSPGRIAAELGLPAWRAQKLARQAGKYKSDDLIRAFRLVAKADHTMKLSREDEVFTLERTVVDIAGLTRKASGARAR